MPYSTLSTIPDARVVMRHKCFAISAVSVTRTINLFAGQRSSSIPRSLTQVTMPVIISVSLRFSAPPVTHSFSHLTLWNGGIPLSSWCVQCSTVRDIEVAAATAGAQR